MRYRRALLLADLRVDPVHAVSALRRVAPALERVLVVGHVSTVGAWWSEVPHEPDARELAALEGWRVAATRAATNTEARHVPELPLDALVDLTLTEGVDLLVAGARSRDTVALLSDAGRRAGIAVLSPAGEARDEPIKRVFCAAIGQRALASIVAFAREHGDPSLEIAVIGPATLPRQQLDTALRVLGISAHVEVLPRTAPSPRRALEVAARGGPVDLVVLPRAPTLLVVGYAWPAPVLVVPPASPSGPSPRAFDVTDMVDMGGAIRGRIDDVTPVGLLVPSADRAFAFVSEGLVRATAITSPSGEIELSPGIEATWLGVARIVDDEAPDALAALEQRFAVLRPGHRPLVLFDSEIADEPLQSFRERTRASGAEPIAVRLRPIRRAAAIRQRLQAAGIPPLVIDARAVLDEGEAHDVGESNDPVRLRRVASRMRAAGFPVAFVLDRGQTDPEPMTDAPAVPIAGNLIEVELDNAKARGWLLEAIAQSRKSVNFQVYMAADDEVGRAAQAALEDAGARGVQCRVLVDSLHAMHGSFGAENPLLARLSARPGVELRVSHRLTKLPTTVTELKGRDHRKVVVVDDRVALVGGRNLSHEYYTGFDEARLTATTAWRQVPWLDAGARIEGPAVGEIASAFLDAWVEAGGAPFPVENPAAAGSTLARVVVHDALRDARTLDAYLEIIERARTHVYAVNGFPYLLEVQHALVRALRRGIRVHAITGHLTPTHDGTPFAGPWAAARTTATDFVHSRLDPIVEAGGDVYLFGVRDLPECEPGLGVIHPHVHAKMMSADGQRCVVGSANLDVTSSYWESELMVVVEDPVVARGLESRLDQLIASSTRVNRDDPTWRERARRRSWMRRWPGVLAL